jgi:hypothetical protein
VEGKNEPGDFLYSSTANPSSRVIQNDGRDFMRRFHSYGPVNEAVHFAVSRKNLVKSCMENLIGEPQEGGHYFTIWAPRQTGKTWLMNRVIREMSERHQDRFDILNFSFGVLRGNIFRDSEEPGDVAQALGNLLKEKLPENPNIKTWGDFRELFSKKNGIWNRPLIMFVDEVDTLSSDVLDIITGQFREMYLDRKNNWLHGLALIGVKAVLGIESRRGSPFNIQRSLRVPSFTVEEVKELFHQYQTESGQAVDPEVPRNVFETTRGQPGLVCWFGELLTEKYNPGTRNTIGMETWRLTCHKASYVEWNNTVLNLVKKAKSEYPRQVMDLFSRSDMEFSLDAPWCGYLYLNGIIDSETIRDEAGDYHELCRFSSPFVQKRLYNAFSEDWVRDNLPILALDPLDDLADVFTGPELNLGSLLERYRNYLKRLKAAGLNPWKDQPRRTDLQLTEAVGYFHLYAWLKTA